MKITVPIEIQRIIDNKEYSIDSIGMSDSQVICFDDMVLKVENPREESDNEHRMMGWLKDKLPVPEIICSKKTENKNYLLMSRISGEMSCDEKYMENPDLLVKLLADGLRMLWNVDIKDCPYDNSLKHKLELAEERVKAGLCDMESCEKETYGENGFKNPEELLQWLKDNQPKEELVFSHGDYCLPNIFINNDQVSGFIDLGRSGIADKYQDIALCYRSLKHNADGSYGGRVYSDIKPEKIFDELEIVPDWDKVKYYILLDELF